MRRHPHLYEIPTVPWLHRHGYPSLGAVPGHRWDRLASLGFDAVWLMGIWDKSRVGIELGRTHTPWFDRYDAALPGWTSADVMGSPYSVRDYVPDSRVGTWDDLAAARAALKARGMALILDWVPNHTGPDHRWATTNPAFYVQQDGVAVAGKDPYLDPWPDTLQLNVFEPACVDACLDVLRDLATRCDGLRCDMAMLLLSDIFRQTWGDSVGPTPEVEYWARVRESVPDLILIAEAYWDTGWRLQQLGFDFTYDKRLYDRLEHLQAGEVRAHLTAGLDYQSRLLRFVENHDEPRAAEVFGASRRHRTAATAIATLPGMRLFYDGQLEGRRRFVPVQLIRGADELVDTVLLGFYEDLLRFVDADVFHRGRFELLDIAPHDDGSHEQLVAWSWTSDEDEVLIVVHLGEGWAQGRVQLAPGRIELSDHDGQTYPRDVGDDGLHVVLGPHAHHRFRVVRDIP